MIRTGKKWIQIQVISSRFTDFFNKKLFSKFLFYFFPLFLSLNLMNHSEMRKFLIIFFFKSLDLGFRSKKVFFCSFRLIFYPLDPDPWIRIRGSASVDPHIFADPDPGSQNLADPTDPDPKHY